MDNLTTHNFHAKYSKCQFKVPTINYLGHIISTDGVTTNPAKLEAIQVWPQPISFTTLHGFLGLTSYYVCFVCHYAQLAAPITDLLKLKRFAWNPSAQQALTNLKAAMNSLATLTLPNFDESFDITTNASNIAIDAVLSQRDHPIAFYTKKMCRHMQASSTYV